MANYFDAFFLLKFRLWSQSEKLLDLTFARIESNPISVSFIHFLRLKKYRYNTTFFFSLQPEICWIRIILGSSLLPNYSHTDYFYQIIGKDALLTLTGSSVYLHTNINISLDKTQLQNGPKLILLPGFGKSK